LVRWSHASGKDASTKGGQRDGAHGRRAQLKRDHRACAPRARVIEIEEILILEIILK
jgi:hypothetical protein